MQSQYKRHSPDQRRLTGKLLAEVDVWLSASVENQPSSVWMGLQLTQHGAGLFRELPDPEPLDSAL